MTTYLEIVPTTSLTEGDVVYTHGLWVRLGPVEQYAEHGGDYAAVGTILNRDALTDDEGVRVLTRGLVAPDARTLTIHAQPTGQWTRQRKDTP